MTYKRFFFSGRASLVAIPYFWLLVFVLLPLILILKISLALSVLGQPPYSPLLDWNTPPFLHIHTGGFQLLASDRLYLDSLLNSLRLAAGATLLCLILAYPTAYYICTKPPAVRLLLVTLIIIPFWSSFLIRVYAWIGLLKSEGLINTFLQWAGFITQPMELLYTPLAVSIGMVYTYLPFMLLPLYAALSQRNRLLEEAASDLGASPARVFLHVTLPLSLPGIFAGSLLVFIPAVGEFVIPDLLGGANTLMLGKTLWTEFFSNRDWPAASALAFVMLIILIAPIAALQRLEQRRSGL